MESLKKKVSQSKSMGAKMERLKHLLSEKLKPDGQQGKQDEVKMHKPDKSYVNEHEKVRTLNVADTPGPHLDGNETRKQQLELLQRYLSQRDKQQDGQKEVLGNDGLYLF